MARQRSTKRDEKRMGAVYVKDTLTVCARIYGAPRYHNLTGGLQGPNPESWKFEKSQGGHPCRYCRVLGIGGRHLATTEKREAALRYSVDLKEQLRRMPGLRSLGCERMLGPVSHSGLLRTLMTGSDIDQRCDSPHLERTSVALLGRHEDVSGIRMISNRVN